MALLAIKITDDTFTVHGRLIKKPWKQRMWLSIFVGIGTATMFTVGAVYSTTLLVAIGLLGFVMVHAVPAIVALLLVSMVRTWIRNRKDQATP